MVQMQQARDIADPRPRSLIESPRAFGYSPESAIADLVDSSIPTGERHIELSFEWNGAVSSVVVSDDGCGIGEAPLVSATTLGSRSPTADLDASNLRRFGLGLRTASFSPGREVAVVRVVRGGHAATHGPRTVDERHPVGAVRQDTELSAVKATKWNGTT